MSRKGHSTFGCALVTGCGSFCVAPEKKLAILSFRDGVLGAAGAGGGAAASHYGSYTTVKLPGTAILITVFFVCFVLYYFINWKYLSELWLFQ